MNLTFRQRFGLIGFLVGGFVVAVLCMSIFERRGKIQNQKIKAATEQVEANTEDVQKIEKAVEPFTELMP